VAWRFRSGPPERLQSAGHARAAIGKQVPWANKTAKKQIEDDEYLEEVLEEMEQIEEQTRPEEDDEQVQKAKETLEDEKESAEFRAEKLEDQPWSDEEEKERKIGYLEQRSKLIDKALDEDFDGLKDLLNFLDEEAERMDNPSNRALNQGVLSRMV